MSNDLNDSKTYKAWEIVKMLEEKKLNQEDLIIHDRENEVPVYILYDILDKITLEEILSWEDITIEKYVNYVTFDEARKSGKKFKYKDWDKFYGIRAVLDTLSDYLEINSMLDEKAWIIEGEEG